MQKGEYPPMNKEIRQELIKFFREYNMNLFELIGKNFEWEN